MRITKSKYMYSILEILENTLVITRLPVHQTIEKVSEMFVSLKSKKSSYRIESKIYSLQDFERPMAKRLYTTQNID